MKDIKNKISKKIDSLDKDKTKRVLKRVGIGTAIVGAGFIGCKIGEMRGVKICDLILGTLLKEHPDLKEPFDNAWNESFGNL